MNKRTEFVGFLEILPSVAAEAAHADLTHLFKVRHFGNQAHRAAVGIAAFAEVEVSVKLNDAEIIEAIKRSRDGIGYGT